MEATRDLEIRLANGVTVRPCPSYRGWFAASDGRVWSARRQWWVTPHLRGGYLQVKTGEKARAVAVHRLAADAFLGPCPPGYEVNHKDLVKTNNVPDNLAYVTRRENIHHYVIATGKAFRTWPHGYQLPQALWDTAIPARIRSLVVLYRQYPIPTPDALRPAPGVT
jgi:HNH endonuclease